MMMWNLLFFLVRTSFSEGWLVLILFLFFWVVGENEEVSIKEVADAIVKAVGFEGHYSVGSFSEALLSPYLIIVFCGAVRYNPRRWTIP